MREFKFITFTADPPPHAELRQLLADLEITPKCADAYGYFVVRLRSDDPRLERLVAALDELPFDPPWSCRREIEYDRADLEAAEYLVVWVTRAEKGNTGLKHGTEYDLSTGCLECGTGARQVSSLRINASALPKKGQVTHTYSHEVLVHETLATELKIDLRSDRGLRQVEDHRTREKLPWWQILPDTYMPPLAPQTKGMTGWGLRAEGEGCGYCRRDGFGGGGFEPFEPVYRMTESERAGLPDFVFTHEHYGVSRLKQEPGRPIGLAYPGTLVSNRALRVFLKNNVRGISFIPVRFI